MALPRAAVSVECPVCGQLSVYVREHDRYFHLDGRDNGWCWAEISSGRFITGPAPH